MRPPRLSATLLLLPILVSAPAADLTPRKMETWWAKFPAPPAGTERFDLEIPPVATFRNIPLED